MRKVLSSQKRGQPLPLKERYHRLSTIVFLTTPMPEFFPKSSTPPPPPVDRPSISTPCTPSTPTYSGAPFPHLCPVERSLGGGHPVLDVVVVLLDPRQLLSRRADALGELYRLLLRGLVLSVNGLDSLREYSNQSTHIYLLSEKR